MDQIYRWLAILALLTLVPGQYAAAQRSALPTATDLRTRLGRPRAVLHDGRHEAVRVENHLIDERVGVHGFASWGVWMIRT